MQHRHEVALTATEATVQVGRLAATVLNCIANKPQCRVETFHQFIGKDVVIQYFVWLRHVLGQLQHEVATMHLFGDLDQVFEERHAVLI